MADTPDFRAAVEPSETTGLRVRSEGVADKPVTVGRERIGQIIGRLAVEDMGRLNTALAFVMGLAALPVGGRRFNASTL